MTTLCLCDYVETGADRERQLATIALYLPPEGSQEWIDFTQTTAASNRARPLALGPFPRPTLYLPYQE